MLSFFIIISLWMICCGINVGIYPLVLKDVEDFDKPIVIIISSIFSPLLCPAFLISLLVKKIIVSVEIKNTEKRLKHLENQKAIKQLEKEIGF